MALPLVGALWLAVLATATDPDPRGYGTHEQLGFSPCSFREVIGGPCPTCGVTTSASHLVHGSLSASWGTQPLGTLLIAALACAFFAFPAAHRRGLDLGEDFIRRGAVIWTGLLTIVLACWLL